MKVCFVCYTNSKCSDVWDMFIKQQNKYSNIPTYYLSDTIIHSQESNTFIYDNNDDYYSVWVNFLNNLDYDFFIYLQEDFILYKQIDLLKIKEYLEYLVNNTEYSFVRLLKSGNLNNLKITDTLFEIESENNDSFSMQPTIWKKNDYIKLMLGVKSKIWLENDDYKKYISLNKIKGLYHFNDEPKRGLNHYDSFVYPYIATALVRGKWNISEYKNELLPLINEYRININIRGTF